jgi:hypothetical protein
MPILVYKMTHTGDPDRHAGIWGTRDCMGQDRDYPFRAVIGVGGTSARHGIAGKLVWIGIDPVKASNPRADWRGPQVMFGHFRYYGDSGPIFRDIAPELAWRLYDGRARVLLHLSPTERREAEDVLARAHRAPASAALASRSTKGRVKAKTCSGD